MAPNKKKKKMAANPARGFATTSIPKQEKEKPVAAEASDAPKEEAMAAPEPVQQPVTQKAVPVQEVSQTPEELEAQLERDELQLLVEKHATRTRRESRRQVSKIQTDRRTLRPQAQSLFTHDWMSDELLDAIIALAQTESNDANRRNGQQPLLKVISEDEGISRLWTLDLVLRDLGFSHDHIQPALRWLCANSGSIDSSAAIWGFQESLEWLSLDQCDDHAFTFEDPKPKRHVIESQSTSRPATPTATTAPAITASRIATPNISTPAESDYSDVAVSDLDSDLEPDQLVETYLKIKGRLFELEPEAVDTKAQKSKGKGRKPAVTSNAAPVRKLLSQLSRLESDSLFDQREADTLWPAKRLQIVQSKAAENKRSTPQAPRDHPEDVRVEIASTESSNAEPINTPEGSVSDEEASGLLGDMFAAIPDETNSSAPEVAPGTQALDSINVTLRDFGKQTGLAPRRLLEDVVRARDPGARLLYKMVSPTTYSCRHSLTVDWFKRQDLAYDAVPGVDIDGQPLRATFVATNVAAISAEQSEGFISTAALFSMFSSSTKEEKVHVRLPPNWRELYKEYLDHKQDATDAADRDIIKHLRSIIHDQVDQEESDGVVLTNRFKMRNQSTKALSSPSGSGRSTPVPTAGMPDLRDLWMRKSSTASYHRMLAARKNLPVYGFREDILSTVDKHQVTIICGETGCGKSTQIPSFILEHQLSKGIPCKVFCTEPRRISAISLAQRVSEELGEGPKDIGTIRSLVGYAIRLESKTSAETRLVYATVGVVLRMLESSSGLEEVSHLIIDEVHERSIDTDFMLIILRSLMLRRPELKVILMSATVDAQRFSSYLNNAPIMNVPGRTFPVETKYLEDAVELTHYTSSDEQKNQADASDEEEGVAREKSGIPSKLPGYSAATRNVLLNYDEYRIDYDLIVRLIESVAFDAQLSHYSNAVLVFLPGLAEIRQLNDMLVGHRSFARGWLVYPLHSTISSEDQQAAFVVPPPGVRKIVLATNIAETGVTIPDITCVIDTGKHKEMRFDERRQLSRLTQSFIARANAKQRRGRAGRVQNGLCFHLFTKYRHDNLMADQQTPEMLRLSLQDLVMRVKIIKLGDIEQTLAEALDPPSSKNVRRAIDALIEVDALTPKEELTNLGRQLAKLPLDAHLGKLVLLSTMFGCVDVAITIAAILSSKSPFVTPFGAKERADIARLAFKKGDSDLLTAYNAYRSWKLVCTTPGRSEMQFCHKNFLSSQNLGNIEDLKAQLLSSLVNAGFIQMSADESRALNRYRSTSRHRNFVVVPTRYDELSDNEILANAVIAAAFYPKILVREGKGWRNIANNQTVSLAPTSVNKATSINPITAQFLSYYHIMQGSNKYYNAHSTSIVHPLPMVLMVGADMDFKLHAGVISLPGNVLRFAARDWRTCTALKVLRRRVREIVNASWKTPGRQLSGREQEWLQLFLQLFAAKREKDERVKERAGGKGK